MLFLKSKWIFVFLICTSFSSFATQRIATLAPHLTEWAYSLGLGEQIVAVSAYSDYPLEAQKKPIVSDANGINLDALIRLKPDLVLMWQGSAQSAQVEKLKRFGIKVHISNPHTLEDIPKQLMQVAKLTDTTAIATKLNEAFLTRLDSIKNQYQHRPKQNTFFQVWHSPIITSNGDSWIQNLLDVCALTNPFSEHSVAYPTVNKEQVMLKNPDIIIISNKSPSSGHGDMWSNLKMINAVKNDRMYYIDPDYLHRLTARVLQGLEHLCDITAPIKTSD